MYPERRECSMPHLSSNVVSLQVRHEVLGFSAAQIVSSVQLRCRPPRKKAGHVLLDVCAAGGPDAALGGLRKVVVGRRGAGGQPLYRFARKLRWGDLWPEQQR